MTFAPAHVLFVQTGDFREAYRRFSDGGAETYRDQKKSVDFVAGLAPEVTTTILAFSDQPYEEDLAPGLRAIGRPQADLTPAAISGLFDAIAPSHVVLRLPDIRVLREIRKRGPWLLPSFADIFPSGGLRSIWQNAVFRRVLAGCRAPCVSNHSLNASRSLVTALAVPPERVVPWDWSPVPLGGTAKDGPADPARPTAFFAGAMTEDKGVGDCLEAVAEVNRRGVAVSMSFAGPGDLSDWQARADALGLAGQVRFLGQISNAEVRQAMRAHDLVIVPSRHSYAEGLPNTIYEALASRSVLIVSDHPAFAGRVVADRDVLVFPAANPGALADCITSALSDAALYHRLSQNAEAAHEALYVGMEWSDMVDRFLRDPENRTGWVEAHALVHHEK